MSWRSWSARVALQLSGRYEPYRLICRWLNVKRPGRCAPWGAQGVDTAYGNSYKGQTIRQQIGSLWGFLSDIRRRTSAGFPILQHSGIYFPLCWSERIRDNGLSRMPANPWCLIYGRRAQQQGIVVAGYKSFVSEIHRISIQLVSWSVLKPDKSKNADFWLKQTWRLDIVHYIRIWSSRTGNVLQSFHLPDYCFLNVWCENRNTSL